MKELNQQVVEIVQWTAGKLDDYGQRSAIGMARGYLDSQKFKEGNPVDVYARRDALALGLVGLMEGHSEDDCIAALQEARRWVNAPFIDPAMMGFQAGREKRGPLTTPGAQKKARAESEKK